MTQDLYHIGDKVNSHSTMVTNPVASLIPLLCHLQIAEKDQKLLGDTENNEDAIEINIFHQLNY
jgi:hypothetical protein